MVFYTLKEFAEIMKVSKKCVRNWISRRLIIPGKLPSGRFVFDENHIKEIQRINERRYTKDML